MKPIALTALAIVTTLAHGLPTTAVANEAVGAYLAARQASIDNDYRAAAKYFTRALAGDPSNLAILESSVVAYVSLGEMERAIPIARKIEKAGLKSQIAFMVLMTDEVKRGDHDAVLSRLKAGHGIGSLADGLISAWSELGKGDVVAAMARFDKVAGEKGLRSFAIYHKALALASVGDFEAAAAIFAGKSDGPMQRTRRGTIAWAQILSQLERNDEAVALIDDTFGTDLDAEIQRLRDRLAAGERVPFDLVSNAGDGVAEVFYSLGQALRSDTSADYVLLYARLAQYLNPTHFDAAILAAELLDSLGRHDLAIAAYKSVPRGHPAHVRAEIGRAEALRQAGKSDAAVEVLGQLARSNPDLPAVHVAAGDLFRDMERYAEAAAAYDRAIALYEKRGVDQWFVHYVRGICHERLGQWDQAEADFRHALKLNPDQPQVLNYLGYSLVDKGRKLDEALTMIKRAVAARPDDGYIVDSLGWALYRLGRFDEAVGHMERAAELMPTDAVVNDHLGDVLWKVGRRVEARFQWQRALSLIDKDNPSPDIDPERIRRKLKEGLDAVLDQEGASGTEVVNDRG